MPTRWASPTGLRCVFRSANGWYDGRVMRAPMRPGNLEVHWPEGNVLLGAGIDPESLEPDYNAVVTLEMGCESSS
jgi:hypothetical protein